MSRPARQALRGGKSWPGGQRPAGAALAIMRQTRWDPVEASKIELERGAMFHARGELGKAVAAWGTALRYDPENRDARYWLPVVRGQLK